MAITHPVFAENPCAGLMRFSCAENIHACWRGEGSERWCVCSRMSFALTHSLSNYLLSTLLRTDVTSSKMASDHMEQRVQGCNGQLYTSSAASWASPAQEKMGTHFKDRLGPLPKQSVEMAAFIKPLSGPLHLIPCHLPNPRIAPFLKWPIIYEAYVQSVILPDSASSCTPSSYDLAFLGETTAGMRVKPFPAPSWQITTAPDVAIESKQSFQRLICETWTLWLWGVGGEGG